ncbi:MAG: tetratricopeptide repeat protein [Candidatus Obscuribacterales bacterium]|nr:tetratricopeptide repeat protein [Candidatus Obscuribacterales bacterium]
MTKLRLPLLVALSVFISIQAAFCRQDKATVEPSEIHMKEGLKKIKAHDYEGASDDFLQSVYFSRNHYNPQAYLYLGLCHKATRNYSKAIEAFLNHLKQVTEPAPNARVDLAECYMNIGDFDKAKIQVDQARAEADYTDKRPIYAMGELYEKMGETGMALDSYCVALGDQPWTYTDAYMGKARCEIKLNNFNNAIKDYRAIIDQCLKNVNWVELYYNLGQCYYKRGDHQGAIDHWHYALKHDPDNFDCHSALAFIFDEEKHYSSAIKEYEDALRCAPKNYNTDKLNRRLIFLQAKLKGDETQKQVRPSPYMRQQEQAQKTPEVNMKDAGF